MRASGPEEPITPDVAGMTGIILFFQCYRYHQSQMWTLPGPGHRSQPSFSLSLFGVGEGLAHDRLLEMLALVGVARDADVLANEIAAGAGRRSLCICGDNGNEGYRSQDGDHSQWAWRGSKVQSRVQGDPEIQMMKPVTLLDSHWKAGSPKPIG